MNEPGRKAANTQGFDDYAANRTGTEGGGRPQPIDRREWMDWSSSGEHREPAQAIASFFERDQFAGANGVRILEVRPGAARTAMTVEARHLNAVGILQGGALFTLADLAFALASNSHGKVAVACQADVTWFKAVRSGELTATAEEISRTRRLSTCVVRVTDEDNELVALFKGVAYIKGTPLGAGDAPEREPVR
jgi:acyl-CoA thioesterase